MKIGIAMMSHETNTFSPVITDLDRFSGGQRAQALRGDIALQTYRGTASCLGGYIEVAEAQNVTIEMGIAASAPPSGLNMTMHLHTCVTPAVAPQSVLMRYSTCTVLGYQQKLGVTTVKANCRAHPRKNSTLPIAISLYVRQHHRTDGGERQDVLTGYHTYPHIDTDSTARRGAEAFFAMLNGQSAKPVLLGHAPMLPRRMPRHDNVKPTPHCRPGLSN